MDDVLPLLVVGCGYVGERLARAQQSRRHVLALVRSASHATDLRGKGIRALRYDLDEAGSGLEPPLAAAAHGAAVVYLVPPPEDGTSDPRLEGFLAWLEGATPAVIVYISTTGVYGDAGGALVDEQTPVAPSNPRAQRRVAAESSVTRRCAHRNVRCVVLRVPGIYGPQRLPLERLARGEPTIRPEEAGPGNRIHVDDLVAAIVAAVERVDARGVYNVTDGDPSSTTVYLQELAQAAGLPPPELVSRAEAASRISPGMLAFLRDSRRVDNRRMVAELGVQLRHPSLRSGIEASLAEMQQPRETAQA
jgi:nucleoside-diphosphate-sugar epimerase